jgi:dCMP deaminase
MAEVPAPVGWDALFMAMAHAVAMRSRDPATKVGAVLVSPDHKRICIGYNGFASGVPNEASWWETRGNDVLGKDTLVRHAEENCLANCYEDVCGWSMYITHHPCVRCASLIVHKHIKNVFFHNDVKSRYNPELSRQVLRLGNVHLIRV